MAQPSKPSSQTTWLKIESHCDRIGKEPAVSTDSGYEKEGKITEQRRLSLRQSRKRIHTGRHISYKELEKIRNQAED
eukprot:1087535-Pelagomonas_calceolata.AAC.2